jgi:hypothetical protein
VKVKFSRLIGCCVWTAGLAAILLSAGCGKGDGKRAVFPVAGKVLIDGQPGAEARLVFYPTDAADTMALKPTAVADEQGNLVVTTYVTGDGAPAGEYKVGLEWPKMVNNFGRIQPGPDRLGGKFKDAASSKWTVRITEGNNTLPDFVVTSK